MRRMIEVPVAMALVVCVFSGCQGCQGTPPPDARVHDSATVDAEPATGTVSLASTIVDLSGSPIGCDRIDPGETLLRMSSLSESPSTETSLPCAISSVTSPPVPAGVYDVTPELHSAGSLLAVATDQRGVVVWSGTDTPLSPIEFVVDATGGLALSLRAGAATGNCLPLANGGAGITTMTIVMTHASSGVGGCAAITLTRRRGGEPIGQYVINCSTPMVASCIETDEVLTASDMASGLYRIIVTGRILARDCWGNDEMLHVSAGGHESSEIGRASCRERVYACV